MQLFNLLKDNNQIHRTPKAAPVINNVMWEVDMSICEEIEKAAGELPEGYILSVHVENGSAWIDMVRHGKNFDVSDVDESGDTIATKISQCVKIAKICGT